MHSPNVLCCQATQTAYGVRLFQFHFWQSCGYAIKTIFKGYLPYGSTGQMQRLWQSLKKSHHIQITSSSPCRRPILYSQKSTQDCELKPICEGLSYNLECAKLLDPAWIIPSTNNRQHSSPPRSPRTSVVWQEGATFMWNAARITPLILWKSLQGRQHKANVVM